jgi:hypothetical protein
MPRMTFVRLGLSIGPSLQHVRETQRRPLVRLGYPNTCSALLRYVSPMALSELDRADAAGALMYLY